MERAERVYYPSPEEMDKVKNELLEEKAKTHRLNIALRALIDAAESHLDSDGADRSLYAAIRLAKPYILKKRKTK